MTYKPSSELQHTAEERINNHNRKVAWLKKSAIHRYGERLAYSDEYMERYKDKRLGEEYEQFLDSIGHP